MIKKLFELYFKAIKEAPRNIEAVLKHNEEKLKEYEKEKKESL